MKRTALFVLGVVALSTSALAQAPAPVPADPIGRPLALLHILIHYLPE